MRQYSVSAHAIDHGRYLGRWRVTSDNILAEYTRIGKPAPKELLDIVQHGISYGNEDFDTLAAAMKELGEPWERLGHLEVNP